MLGIQIATGRNMLGGECGVDVPTDCPLKTEKYRKVPCEMRTNVNPRYKGICGSSDAAWRYQQLVLEVSTGIVNDGCYL